MAEKNEHTVINGCIVTVAGGLILAGVLWLVPKAYAFVRSTLLIVWNFLTSKSILPNYLLLLLVVLSLIAIIRSILVPILTKKRITKLSWQDYRSDNIFGVNWVWNYGDGYIKHDNIFAYCPECSLRLIIKSMHRSTAIEERITLLFCERCNKTISSMEGSLDYILSKVVREIERRINTDEWKNVVNPMTE